MTQTESARWVYHGHNGGGGKVRGLKNKLPFATCASLSRGGEALTCLFSASGYGAEGPQEWWAKPHTLLVSPTHPYDRKETEATQRDKTGR